MRWPLRNQILARLLILLLVTISAVTLANIRSVIQSNRHRELGQMTELRQLLLQSRFPLSDTVLENMKSLSGAEFVLKNATGDTVAKTSMAPDMMLLSPHHESTSPTSKEVAADGVDYYYEVVERVDPRSPGGPQAVHIFVPQKPQREVWWQASKSPLLIATLILPFALIFGLALSRQVTRPLSKFREQVQAIADGKLEQIQDVGHNDEIGDLHQSINEMAIRLQDHDRQLRQNERLNAMVHIGNGIAHHLRNSATGCKLAIELLADEHSELAQSENFEVAIRQLDIMSTYIRKFWMLSQSSAPVSEATLEPVDLGQILQSVELLVKPAAIHLDVDLSVAMEPDSMTFPIPSDDAQQVMLNLINNAITASSQRAASATDSDTRAIVDVSLRRNSDGQPEISVADNGSGPPTQIQSEIFEPFVTGSSEGTGLGLSLVKEIASRSRSTVQWRRENGLTIFEFQFGSSDANAPERLSETR